MIYDVLAGNLLTKLGVFAASIETFAFSSDGTRLTVAVSGGTLVLWQLPARGQDLVAFARDEVRGRSDAGVRGDRIHFNR